jgi:glycosyltransferase involved in cell wall biosynthesis
VLDGKRVAVVVPAHDEEKLIAETIRGIPDFVDRVYVVDDRSRDGTAEVVRSLTDSRVKLIEHEQNLGVGGAIITGYKRARDDGIDVTAVMAVRQPGQPSWASPRNGTEPGCRLVRCEFGPAGP